MNKNPFVPTPSYPQHQPPLPPGPPPAQAPDYSAYWAAQGAQQPGQPGAAGYPPYNGQWTAPQPAPAPTAQQSALFANYGYGGQQAHQHQQWQQQQQQRPPQPMYQQLPPPPPAQQMQQAYNPYQPQMPYQPQQPQYASPPTVVPQSIPMQPSFPAPVQAPAQQYFPQPPAPIAGPMQNGVHHTPPQNLPPAKRQRFDRNNNGPRPPIAQSQFGPGPQTSSSQQNIMAAQPMAGGPPPAPRGGVGPMGSMGGGMGGGRGGGGMGRGGAPGMRGGKPGFQNTGGRGGMAGGHRGGRGGGSFNVGAGGGRGGAQGGGSGPVRGHGSHGGFGGGQGGRGGGSFSARGGQQGFTSRGPGGSLRGRGGNQSHHGRGRHDAYGTAGGPVPLGPSASMNGGSPRKEENRRTLTDFKIVGLEIPELSWSWGVLPKVDEEPQVKEEPASEVIALSEGPLEGEPTVEDDTKPLVHPADEAPASTTIDVKVEPSDLELKPETEDVPSLSEPTIPEGPRAKHEYDQPPPSRIRIYFHTPVTADDARPIPYNTHGAPETSDSARKGKRKKGDDDSDDDAQRARARPPPGEEHERGSVAPSIDMDQASVAPSIAETASEADWLMAAFAEESVHGDDPEGGEDDDHFATQEEHEPPVGDSGDPDVSKDTSANGLGPHSADASGAEHGVVPGEDCISGPSEENSVVVGEHDEVDEAAATEAAVLSAPESDAIPGLGDAEAPTEPVVTQAPIEHASAEVSTTVEVAAPVLQTEPMSASVEEPKENGGIVTDGGGREESLKADSACQQEKAPATEALVAQTAPPLKASASFASTVPDEEEVEASLELGVVKAINEGEAAASEENPSDEAAIQATQIVEEAADTEQATQTTYEEAKTAVPEDDVAAAPGSPAASSSKTLASPGSSKTYAEVNHVVPATKVEAKDTDVSANRLSISYAGGNRRLVVNASVVDKLKVFRREARIEVHLTLDKNEDGVVRGILMEGLSEETKSYLPLAPQPHDGSAAEDATIPPFLKASPPAKLLLHVHLDTMRPLSEPKWVRSGDIQDWLKSIFGGKFWVAGDAADGWERRIEVADPDPAPTIWSVLEGWAVNSPAGLVTERQRFLKTHMTETENILEILLRLTRGERATLSSHPTISATSVSGPLLATLTQGGTHAEQQNHVSLAVLAMFQMAVDFAKRALGDENGRKDADERIGEIIRCLPSHLIYKSLDGIFKEWRGEKRKGGR